ncbi:IclR family transcriptional regulator [Phytoactinopolyspora halotolerans]|uniref:IclR family transcriptional regulator n=1 Tax=Phytoactinopolyspora halotolerans TaxID=1981512 RepID=A0A6L9S9Z3_9ACTN|nr:IclR family transcriptional regulator [Phytoactinopolyspora halotolerans]NEE01897.1 IclR family transcriptional regulator [Phytoactinopolyspora halotolerans]
MEQGGDSRDSAYSIRAVQRVCNILDLIQESPESFSLTQVAEVTALPKSSAYRYLATLESRRYVMRDPLSGTYRIGPAFLPLQSRQLTVLADRVRPHLMRLRDEFRETFNLGILDGYRVSYVEIVESPHSVRLAARPGDRDHLHCTALGKAIAAGLEEDRVKAILYAEGLPRRTPATITDLPAYLEDLARVRERGYAVDDTENEPDGRCVAVPLSDIGLPAAISISAPTTRLTSDGVANVAKALADAAVVIRQEFTGAAG